MNTSDLAQSAYIFIDEFKAHILRQIDDLNMRTGGALQDGYNAWYIDDGWISLKGFSWGFVMHYDDPVRIDMTFGPGWPFVGYRVIMMAQQVGDRIAWVNKSKPDEIVFDAEQLANYGLRKLACKAGDDWIFSDDYARAGQQSTYMPVHHDSYREHI